MAEPRPDGCRALADGTCHYDQCPADHDRRIVPPGECAFLRRLDKRGMRFRKKPVVIEAMQFNEETREAVIAWCGCRHHAIGEQGEEYETLNLFIRTREGEMMARPGDWIIKGVQGEFYPCKPDIFKQTYEPAP